MVDLGTEFAVQTDASGNSLVRVHEGAISVSMLDPEGVTHISDILGEGDLLALRPHEPVPIREGPGGEELPRVPPVPEATLSISEDYISAVRDSGPVIYWRFEELDAEGMVPDGGSLGCRGRLVNEAPPRALALKNGAVHFQRSGRPRHVASERLLPGINTEELTVELWAQTTHVAWQTLFGMVIRQPPNEKKAAAVLEFAHESDFLHGPMAIRGLSRAQPAPRGGTNVFANDVWMPGAWHHVVLVRSRDSLQLFVDGQLASECTYSPSGDTIPYRIVLGQLHAVQQGLSRHPPRRFVGALDEFALYDRALTPAEIATHHHLGMQHGE
jgi:hypothetical protein